MLYIRYVRCCKRSRNIFPLAEMRARRFCTYVHGTAEAQLFSSSRQDTFLGGERSLINKAAPLNRDSRYVSTIDQLTGLSIIKLLETAFLFSPWRTRTGCIYTFQRALAECTYVCPDSFDTVPTKVAVGIRAT